MTTDNATEQERASALKWMELWSVELSLMADEDEIDHVKTIKNALQQASNAAVPVAWMYEVLKTGFTDGHWFETVSQNKPAMPDSTIRNLVPLYTTPPTETSQTVDVERMNAIAAAEGLIEITKLDKEYLGPSTIRKIVHDLLCLLRTETAKDK